MNEVFVTGYIPADAEKAYTPAGAPKLQFDMKLRDSEGAETVQKMTVDDPLLVQKYEPLLTSGRVAIVKGELISKPFYKLNVLSGYIRLVRVLKAEFPNRTNASKPADQENAA